MSARGQVGRTSYHRRTPPSAKVVSQPVLSQPVPRMRPLTPADGAAVAAAPAKGATDPGSTIPRNGSTPTAAPTSSNSSAGPVPMVYRGVASSSAGISGGVVRDDSPAPAAPRRGASNGSEPARAGPAVGNGSNSGSITSSGDGGMLVRQRSPGGASGAPSASSTSGATPASPQSPRSTLPAVSGRATPPPARPSQQRQRQQRQQQQQEQRRLTFSQSMMVAGFESVDEEGQGPEGEGGIRQLQECNYSWAEVRPGA